MWWTLFIIFLLVSIFSLIALFYALRRINQYENLIIQFQQIIEFSTEKMKQVDAFDKLAENIINTFKFSYFDYPFQDVKNEVVAFMVMNLHKYDHTKGSKAFSYFSIVAKNYLILHNNANYKKLKITDEISTYSVKQKLLGRTDDTEKHTDIVEELIRYFEETIPNLFKKKKDIEIAYAIIELFKRKDEIENFNKKALYVLIREMTNVETAHITKVANVLRRHYPTIINRIEGIDTKKLKLNKFF